MASVVLLMDACVNGTGLPQDEIRRGEVAEALRIVEDARSHSLAASILSESLTQVLSKHRAQKQEQKQISRVQLEGASAAAAAAAPVMNTTTTHMHQRPDPLVLGRSPTHVIARGLDRGGPMGAIPDQLPVANCQPPYCDQLAQSLEEQIDLDDF
ncbi:Rsm22-cox11 tandem protein 1, mitochondrial [Tolypocladium paradoxum]|uniref:Rsm22-cox11 tandem protein 1, mitochondrial n=1 Tax=Tolypocladium paradoxum TaxID=94208 RepID=A0A2S4KMT7_9HYPO|nr:Rsm22-cox11 tandem protein 1, mitochondrial [Tolypocladium paradoxum]